MRYACWTRDGEPTLSGTDAADSVRGTDVADSIRGVTVTDTVGVMSASTESMIWLS